MDNGRPLPVAPTQPRTAHAPTMDLSSAGPARPLSQAEAVKRSYRLSQSAMSASQEKQYLDPLGPAPASAVLEHSPSTGRYTHIRASPDDGQVDRALVRRPSSPSIGPWDSASQRYMSTSLTPLAANHEPLPPLPKLSASFPLPRHSPIPVHAHAKSAIGGLPYIAETGGDHYSTSDRPASQPFADDNKIELQALISGEQGMVGHGARADAQRPASRMYQNHDASPLLYEGLEQEDKTRRLEARQNKRRDWLFPTGCDRLLALFGVKWAEEPLQQQIERKRRGVGGQRWPVAAWTMAAAMIGVLVYELILNHRYTGSPIAIHPSFNPMIGPTAEVLIRVGSRFDPCIKFVDALPPTMALPCLTDPMGTSSKTCTIEDICGHGGFPNGVPNQTWRFVTPIFIHVGILHLLFNMLAQVLAGAQVEREMGTVPFLVVYFAGGIYGFALGGNFLRTGIPSAGASGALFATNACVLVDLVLHWKYEERPKLKAVLLLVEFLVGFAMGYIPNAVDGLAHLGGWAMGILTGIILYPSISETKRRRYIIWTARAVALLLIILAFVLTFKNFYTKDPNAACEWCRYLSCIPTASNEHCSGTGITTTRTSSTRRSVDLL